MNTDQLLNQIQTRNQQVEKDKAWETSLFRRMLLLIFTYGGACVFLLIIKVENAFLAAVIPAMGYWFSTLSLPWIRNQYEKLNKK